MIRKLFIVIALLSLGFFCGCSGDEPYTGPELIPVDGLVSLDGKPLSHARLTLIPTGNTPGQGALAQTDEAGRFSLKCVAGRGGAAAGTYRVVITRRVRPDGTPLTEISDVGPIDSDARQILPECYSSFEHSELTATVAADSPLEFHLRSKVRRRW